MEKMVLYEQIIQIKIKLLKCTKVFYRYIFRNNISVDLLLTAVEQSRLQNLSSSDTEKEQRFAKALTDQDIVTCALTGKKINTKTDRVDSNTPLLLRKSALSASIKLDLQNNTTRKWCEKFC